MEKLVTELKKMVSFKDTTAVGDIVLIAANDPPMLVYALVNSIERDSSRRDEWWHVTMSLLTVPPQQVAWTLRTPQMTGLENFTMGGEGRFMKAVEFSRKSTQQGKDALKKNTNKSSGLKRVK